MSFLRHRTYVLCILIYKIISITFVLLLNYCLNNGQITNIFELKLHCKHNFALSAINAYNATLKYYLLMSLTGRLYIVAVREHKKEDESGSCEFH